MERSIWDDLTDDEEPKIIPPLQDHEKSLMEYHPCTLCPQQFDDPLDFQAHMFDHNREVLCKCNVCGEMLKFPEVFNEHIKMHKLRANEKMESINAASSSSCKCKVCGKTVKFPDNFSKHMQMHVRNSELDEETITRNNENKVRLGGYSVECRSCNNVFYTRSDFIRHINTVHKKTYTCDVCNQCCGNYISFSLHKRLHGASNDKKTNKSQNEEEGGNKPHKCDRCDKFFTYLAHLRRHLKLQHHVKYENEVRFTCDVCNKALSSLTTLNNHKQLHVLNPNKCMYCKKSVAKPGFLRRHMKKHLNMDANNKK